MPDRNARSSRGDRKERADHAKLHKRLVKNGSAQQRSDGTTSIMLKAKKGGERKTGEKALKPSLQTYRAGRGACPSNPAIDTG